MYHSVNIHLTNLLAEAMNIPLIHQSTPGEKEHELKTLKNLLSSLTIDGVISGAIASEYQRTRIEQICHELSIKSFTPLWHKNQQLLLKEMVQAGFEIIIVGISAEGLDETWLGRTINTNTIIELKQLEKKYGINIAGEGGEFETLVLDGPIYQQRVSLIQTDCIWKRDHGQLNVIKAELLSKP